MRRRRTAVAARLTDRDARGPLIALSLAPPGRPVARWRAQSRPPPSVARDTPACLRQVFEILLSRGYSENNFREDLKSLYLKLGLENKTVMFLFTDAHVAEEGFLELINNMLTSGGLGRPAGCPRCGPALPTCAGGQAEGSLRLCRGGARVGRGAGVGGSWWWGTQSGEWGVGGGVGGAA